MKVQDIQAQLLNAIASYSDEGKTFEIRTGPPLEFGATSVFPPGEILRGRVRKAHRIGLGIRRERAQLEIEFDRCRHRGQPSANCSVRLIGIDNAREQVGRENRIQGILAASSPNSLLQGIWFRPPGAILHRGPTGLTGPIGALQSRLAPSPIGAALTVASKLILFSLPNPEIELPAGTELILRIVISDDANDLEATATPVPDPVALHSDAAKFLSEIPTEIRNSSGALVADRVNFAFFANEESIAAAFTSTGWTTADPLTRKSFRRSYAAFTSMRCYEKAPVSPLFYQRRLPDLVFQKSFNTISKRHHIRLWRIENPPDADGTPLWVGAATHDIGVAFDWNRLSLTHRVDGFLDNERSKILNDLSSNRCLQNLTLLERPALAGDATDGKLAVALLQPCELPESSGLRLATPLERPRISVPVRVARRLVLETRHYFTRGNAYYWTYRGVRRVTTAMLRRQKPSSGSGAQKAYSAGNPSISGRTSSLRTNGLR